MFEEERTLERLRPKIGLLARLLESVADLPTVREVRQVGLMVGIEIEGYELGDRIGHQVTLEARRRGAIVRPLGDVVILMPPLSMSEQDLRRLVATTAESIAAATGAGSLAAAA